MHIKLKFKEFKTLVIKTEFVMNQQQCCFSKKNGLRSELIIGPEFLWRRTKPWKLNFETIKKHSGADPTTWPRGYRVRLFTFCQKAGLNRAYLRGCISYLNESAWNKEQQMCRKMSCVNIFFIFWHQLYQIGNSSAHI